MNKKQDFYVHSYPFYMDPLTPKAELDRVLQLNVSATPHTSHLLFKPWGNLGLMTIFALPSIIYGVIFYATAPATLALVFAAVTFAGYLLFRFKLWFRLHYSRIAEEITEDLAFRYGLEVDSEYSHTYYTAVSLLGGLLHMPAVGMEYKHITRGELLAIWEKLKVETNRDLFAIRGQLEKIYEEEVPNPPKHRRYYRHEVDEANWGKGRAFVSLSLWHARHGGID